MAKKKIKSYTEAELIKTFGLQRLIKQQTLRMQAWLQVEPVQLLREEQYIFDTIYEVAFSDITGWSEEDLKMKFISPVLFLANLRDNARFRTFFEKTISDTVEGYFLKTKTDFMIASGILNLPDKPFFHFQEYKPELNPTGEPLAQLLEAMLIAQHQNDNHKPIYGCSVVGKQWNFVVLEQKTYCISKTYDCTEREELLLIIAILRKFKDILETELLDIIDN